MNHGERICSRAEAPCMAPQAPPELRILSNLESDWAVAFVWAALGLLRSRARVRALQLLVPSSRRFWISETTLSLRSRLLRRRCSRSVELRISCSGPSLVSSAMASSACWTSSPTVLYEVAGMKKICESIIEIGTMRYIRKNL